MRTGSEPATIGHARSAIALDIAHVRVVSIDLVPAVVGDVQALPFPTGTFDAGLAMHMLYHVPDIRAGVAELRRVLREGGVLADTWLEVADVERIVDELQRLRYMLELNLAPGAAWDDMIEGVRRDAQAVIERDGAFRMSENHGLFTCR